MEEQFGRYQLSRLVGTGGMAQVHLARQVGPQGFVKPCVLKRIATASLGDDEVRRMFLEEARISALLNHPHIVQTFDFGVVDGVPYMAMELVDGVNLAQLCRTLAKAERWIPLRSALEICIAVAEALAYAHAMADLGGRPINLVHRDVSPQNILVSRQGSVKLSDFGIARHDARENMTIGPAAKGKPGYMAPEQAMGAEVDARADIFALGVVITELISARRLIRSGQPVANLLAVSKRVKELLDLRSETPAELKQLALEMTALEMDERPASARLVADRLRKVAAGVPERASLPVFLAKVFERYFPNDVLGANTLTPGTGASSGFATVDPGAKSPAPSDDDNDPTKVAPPPHFEAEAWTKEPAAVGAASVYEQGWPKEYLDEKPKLELVARSSSVDAMQYFKAQGSVQDVPPPVDEPPQQDTVQKPMIVFGSPRAESVRPFPKVLQPEEPKPPPAWKKLVPLIGAGVGIGLLAFGVLFAISKSGGEEKKPVAATRGSVLVQSNPPGATIIVDGLRSKHVTPYELADMPLDRPIRLAVVLEGHLATPVEASISIPASTRQTTARFTLKRGRVFQLQTEPAGATVDLDGRKLGSITPLELPAIPFGETATLAIELDGFLPMTLPVRAVTETATIVTAKLEPARQVDIVSEPPGARVFIDNVLRGQTPVYDLWVPEKRTFRVRVERKGYKTWRKMLNPRKLRERLVEADLETLPLLAMPMTKEERVEAKDFDRKLNRVERAIRAAKKAIEKAEANLASIESSPNIFIGRIADAHRELEEAKAKLEELENEKVELDNQLDMFRHRVMSKLE